MKVQLYKNHLPITLTGKDWRTIMHALWLASECGPSGTDKESVKEWKEFDALEKKLRKDFGLSRDA